MHALKWANLSTRMFFAPDDEGGSGSASSVASSSPSGGDSGGGSSSPSPDGGGGASPAAPSSPDTGGTDSPLEDWSALGSTEDLDSFTIPAAPTSSEPAAVAPPPPPVAAPVPPTPAPAAQPAASAPAPAAPAPAQPAANGEADVPQLSPSDPVGIANAIEQNREAVIAHLAQSRFALTQEDIAELEDNAAVFVPKMMARVYQEAHVSMMKFLAQAVPGMVKQFNTVNTANNEAEDQFFGAHKALGLDKSNKAHREAAFRIAKIYRQANPQMPMEQLIADVGPMVAMSLRLPLVPGTPAAAASPQPVPAAPRPTGFRPAVNGGGGAPPVAEPESEWAGMGREYD